MVDKTILVTKIVPKKPEHYKFVKEGRPGNPTSLHPNNYVNRATLRISEEDVRRISDGDSDALGELEQTIRDKGLLGEFSVRTCGGPGPKRMGESKMQYRARIAAKGLGQREIARIVID